MTGPLRIQFEVSCPARHAFTTWTTRIGTWWPTDHSVSGAAGLAVVLEERIGGRIYERTPEGIEHEWGAVTMWSPPSALGYSWHLGREPDEATDVKVRFIALDHGRTRVEIEQSGWDRLGSSADVWMDRNRRGWDSLLPHFSAAIEKGSR